MATMRKKGKRTETAEALRPPLPKEDSGSDYGEGTPLPPDVTDDPMLREKPVGTGTVVNWGTTPTLAADEVEAERKRHEKKPRPSKKASAEMEMRRGGKQGEG